MAYGFLNLAEDTLREKKEPLSVNEIWEYSKENGTREKINSSGKTPWKTLAALMYVDIKNNTNTKLKQVSKRPAKFGIKGIKYDQNIQQNNEKEEDDKFNERDLHPLLTRFVFANQHFRCCTKTIFHEISKKRGTGFNKWLHPDMVGIHFPYEEYAKMTIELMNSFNECKYKIYSFEMKKALSFENLRECYFQAVSNSSWANEGYLVALEINQDDEFMDEIRRLNNAFGIGVIRLNANNVEESEVLFPAKINEILDWDTIDRLIEDNKDFANFADLISDTRKTNKVSKEYDPVLNDEEYQKHIKTKKIM